MMNDRYLMHYGVKGMKWGVRRYQNADGTLTQAGRTRYNYGDVSLRKNNYKDVDSYTLSKNGKTLEVSTRSLRSMEQSTDEAVTRLIASQMNISVKKAVKKINTDQNLAKSANKLIDQYMNTKLSQAIEQYGQSKPKKISEQTAKPKYTQKQAIEKGYSDLEKKHPDFYSYPQEKQDKLWMEYMNKSGLYKYV